MPPGSPSRGYAPTNAHVKYTYTAFDQSEVTQRRSWGLNGIKGAGLGFDGGRASGNGGTRVAGFFVARGRCVLVALQDKLRRQRPGKKNPALVEQVVGVEVLQML